ncbi:MAG: D-alanyl-D-alanine endopeptidase [Methylotenera sp.]|jgi:D-alanyl-D-alanine endopeptidase (penicillin-binding protein 7)|uniref:D-alanyl-D-alanine endopeptidase n=1 Tax=Methylotenera sp. TaxID=2051956 RepID=UPI000D4B7A2D|nr:D-alanyl-D-alanine endopeptidase [Methylotenera sp.]MDP3210090.1 D-alanyl-D-alanine endopeptidase [Methylotenera sp.]MDP3777793.1 D-alanyl-D-alanine endopeptidase [Methylotenera sp.]PPD00190.1 MAG: D-alanyl-D-alanine endopeptidase [Methylotenera sp.]
MKSTLRKFILVYISLALSLAPVAADAATDKKHRQVSKQSKSSSKYKAVKYKSSSIRVKTRLPARKAIASVDHYDGTTPLKLASAKALVINQLTGEVLFAKNTNLPTPIASVTKLMTAMVMLDAHLPMDDLLYISDEDVDYLKHTTSRLSVGTMLTRGELLQLALMASENRAASALGRNYPGGPNAFVKAMNQKARLLGMNATRFVDATGLDSNNVSTAEDLVKMVDAAYHYPEIRQVSTLPSQEITLYGRQNPLNFVNTNALVRGGKWDIGLSKTGFINEAGRCLVMQAHISGQPVIIVLLDSVGKLTRIGDANRIRKWVENNEAGSLGTFVSG